MTFKRIEDIEVWRLGCDLAKEIYNKTSTGSLAKDWGLRDQIRRSAISIPSNIAEGFERNSNREFRRFLLIAKGSCAELRTQLTIVKSVALLPDEIANEIIDSCIEISSKLQNLITYLSNLEER